MKHQRDAFGVGPEAGFDADSQVITDAYTGGPDNLKKALRSPSNIVTRATTPIARARSIMTAATM